MEYNISSGPIQWSISTSIKVTIDHFSLALFKLSGNKHLHKMIHTCTHAYKQRTNRWSVLDDAEQYSFTQVCGGDNMVLWLACVLTKILLSS